MKVIIAIKSFPRSARPSARLFRALFLFAELQNQQTIVIVAGDGRVFDRAGKLDDFFEPAVSDFKLIVRNTLTADAVSAQAADAQKRAVDGDFDISGLDAGEIDFHDPTVMSAIHVGRRIPQTPRRTAGLPVRALITIKYFAGHRTPRRGSHQA